MNETVEEEIAEAIGCIALEIAIKAMQENGIGMFMPLDRPPKEAVPVVAFFVLVALTLKAVVNDEGYDIPDSMPVSSAASLFLLHPDEQKAETIKAGSKAASYILGARMANVEEWKDNLYRMAVIYIMALRNQLKAIPITEVESLYGSMLKVIISSIEWS